MGIREVSSPLSVSSPLWGGVMGNQDPHNSVTTEKWAAQEVMPAAGYHWAAPPPSLRAQGTSGDEKALDKVQRVVLLLGTTETTSSRLRRRSSYHSIPGAEAALVLYPESASPPVRTDPLAVPESSPGLLV